MTGAVSPAGMYTARTVAALTALTLGSPCLAAEENPWEVTGAAGLSWADGNSQSVAYSLQLLASRITPDNELYLGGDYFFAESKGAATTDSLKLSAQYNHLAGERFYYGATGQYLTDHVADLDYRIDVGGLLGWYFIKTERDSLAVEFGPGYTWEKQGRTSSDYVNLRFAQRFEHKLGPGAKLWQSVAFIPEAGDFSNHLITGEIGLDTRVTDHWSVRTFLRYQRDNTPALGREKDDLSLMLGVGYSLAGFPEPEKPGRRTLKPKREAPAAAAKGWTTTAALGYSLASGNSDTRALNLGFDTAYRADTHEFFFTTAYAFGENNGATSIEQLRADTRLRRLFGERFFAGGGIAFLHDDVADLSYRITPGATAGWYLFKQDGIALSLEAGPGYTFEESGGVTSDYLSLTAAERLSVVLAPRLTFNQSAVWEAEAADLDNHTVTVAATLDTDITTSLAFRIGATWLYDNTPAAGREHHDTTLTSGIAVRF